MVAGSIPAAPTNFFNALRSLGIASSLDERQYSEGFNPLL
jgi:hypothetical protein